MTKYILECPECEARFDLLRYAPEKRVKCRKCGAAVIIPYAPGDAPPVPVRGKALAPEVRTKLVRIFSLKKLALIAGLLAVALAGGLIILVQKGQERDSAPDAETKPPEKVTLATVPILNRLLALPLGRGFSWKYEVKGGGTEDRQVVTAFNSREGEPEYDLQTTGSLQTGKQTLRVRNDGIYLVSELRTDGRWNFPTPLKILPHPIHSDDTWVQEGSCVKEGGAAEPWKLACAVTLVEQIECAGAKFPGFRVEVKGTRGARPVEEILWYARGVGLLKRISKIDGKIEETILKSYTQR